MAMCILFFLGFFCESYVIVFFSFVVFGSVVFLFFNNKSLQLILCGVAGYVLFRQRDFLDFCVCRMNLGSKNFFFLFLVKCVRRA